MQKVLVIVGPTASGKSDLGIELAKQYNGEIINGDAIQVYQGLDIGSAKISESEMAGIKHHLLDYVAADEDYNVARFKNDARDKIKKINDNGKLPIIVGGTGLYIRACLYDYDFPAQIEDRIEISLSNEELYNKLKEVDPEALKKIHINNRQRLLRAYEVYLRTGIPFSKHIAKQKHEQLYNSLIIALDMDREELYKRIDLRVEKMFEKGLEQEIRSLLAKGISFEMRSMQAIGYKEFKDYIQGDLNIEELKALIKKDTRNFAKRQYTWLRHQLPVKWFHYQAAAEIKEEVNKWLNI